MRTYDWRAGAVPGVEVPICVGVVAGAVPGADVPICVGVGAGDVPGAEVPICVGVGAGAVPGAEVPVPQPLVPHVRGWPQPGGPQLCRREGRGHLPQEGSWYACPFKDSTTWLSPEGPKGSIASAKSNSIVLCLWSADESHMW